MRVDEDLLLDILWKQLKILNVMSLEGVRRLTAMN
jgi:hypothetical protein